MLGREALTRARAGSSARKSPRRVDKSTASKATADTNNNDDDDDDDEFDDAAESNHSRATHGGRELTVSAILDDREPVEDESSVVSGTNASRIGSNDDKSMTSTLAVKSYDQEAEEEDEGDDDDSESWRHRLSSTDQATMLED